MKPANTKITNYDKYKIQFSDFEIIEQIDSGGFGIIQLAKYKKSQHLYAAKIIKLQNDKDYFNRIMDREIGIMISSRHPTIIKFYGFSLSESNGEKSIILIMQYHKNGSLKKYLQNFSNQNTIEYSNTSRQIILIGIARGMMYLHQKQIIHRDLKPGNILLDNKYHPIITDFGLSKMYDINDSKSPSICNGTYAYMAPEVIEGIENKEKADVYSFAIIMYEIVTGLKPYPELSNNQITPYKFLLQIVNNNLRPKFTSNVKKPIQKLIEKCWSQDRHKRPSFEQIFSILATGNGELNDDEKVIICDDEPKYYLENVDKIKINEYLNELDNSIKKQSKQTNTIENQSNNTDNQNKPIEIQNNSVKKQSNPKNSIEKSDRLNEKPTNPIKKPIDSNEKQSKPNPTIPNKITTNSFEKQSKPNPMQSPRKQIENPDKPIKIPSSSNKEHFKPTKAIDKPISPIKNQYNPIENPANPNKKPISKIENPYISNEKQSETTKVIERPAGPIKRPTSTIEMPEKPNASIKKQSKQASAIESSIKPISKTTEPVKKTINTAENPIKENERPNISIEKTLISKNPTNTIGKPADSIKIPTSTIEIPTKPAGTLIKSTEKTNPSIQKQSKQTNTIETSIKPISKTTEPVKKTINTTENQIKENEKPKKSIEKTLISKGPQDKETITNNKKLENQRKETIPQKTSNQIVNIMHQIQHSCRAKTPINRPISNLNALNDLNGKDTRLNSNCNSKPSLNHNYPRTIMKTTTYNQRAKTPPTNLNKINTYQKKLYNDKEVLKTNESNDKKPSNIQKNNKNINQSIIEKKSPQVINRATNNSKNTLIRTSSIQYSTSDQKEGKNNYPMEKNSNFTNINTYQSSAKKQSTELKKSHINQKNSLDNTKLTIKTESDDKKASSQPAKTLNSKNDKPIIKSTNNLNAKNSQLNSSNISKSDTDQKEENNNNCMKKEKFTLLTSSDIQCNRPIMKTNAYQPRSKTPSYELNKINDKEMYKKSDSENYSFIQSTSHNQSTSENKSSKIINKSSSYIENKYTDSYSYCFPKSTLKQQKKCSSDKKEDDNKSNPMMDSNIRSSSTIMKKSTYKPRAKTPSNSTGTHLSLSTTNTKITQIEDKNNSKSISINEFNNLSLQDQQQKISEIMANLPISKEYEFFQNISNILSYLINVNNSNMKDSFEIEPKKETKLLNKINKNHQIRILKNCTDVLINKKSLVSNELKKMLSKIDRTLIEIKYPSDSFKQEYKEINNLNSFAKSNVKVCVVISNVQIDDIQKNKNISRIRIDPSIDSILINQFINCTYLKEVIIPSSVRIIGNNAFQGCSNLKKIELGEYVDVIGNYAFSDCCSIEKVIIPSKVTSIGVYAFNKCYRLYGYRQCLFFDKWRKKILKMAETKLSSKMIK